MKIKVENESLVRDTASNAILETDTRKLHKHRAIKQALRDKEDKLDFLLDKINKLETIIDRMTHGNINT
jgi:5-methylcytosine-specific restriction endonuclease McrBC regulatory subunit McrC